MPIAIKIESVSKQYRLGEIGTGSLAHDVNRWWYRVRGKEDPYLKVGEVNDRSVKGSSEYVWALKDVSFDIKQGEVVGIIGRNGAGKSTLLKILSRVTSPTSGSIKARGRIASLLEVGTGFHPELTGRENIYLNGAILGMRKHEITLKLDEIIDFSGCDRHINTPVKRYSSGMYVRLAFAVAAHLDPEIMIIDEVLAVGDGDFQKKCLGKMRNMHDEGRTVIIVSHQMSMITALCDRGVVMKNGAIDFVGSASNAVLRYQPSNGGSGQAVFDAELLGKKIGDERAQLHKAWTENTVGDVRQVFDMHESVVIRMEYSISRQAARLYYPNFHIFDEKGEHVFVTAAAAGSSEPSANAEGRWIATCTIPGNLLNTGTFYIGVAVTGMDPGVVVAFWERDALAIQVTEDMEQTLDGARNGYAGHVPGPIRPNLPWTVERCSLTV